MKILVFSIVFLAVLAIADDSSEERDRSISSRTGSVASRKNSADFDRKSVSSDSSFFSRKSSKSSVDSDATVTDASPTRPSFGDFVPTCRQLTDCFADSECGRNGRCVGIYVGTCDCDACANNQKCQFDHQCGGLKGACDWEKGKCNCSNGFKKSGFENFNRAREEFCNIKKCVRDGEECHGLPCRKGKCMCN
ncbi:unnamed protein product [Bursaphelenchus xylophilus]|uniref:(pine wood nematode) hypothetical protein n=1 Tax=Bursaphelenchus xylophilus TaxID=6326 RepID=A0A7I8XEC2_BURXY|nr:unnamed protein product [Bursaphelenchus xylophilus]CAG9113360.1 unnamed protein product [Bursaphelenchus xylophilus]